jgi:putative ABC transport system substrate-binding protein
LAALAVVAAPYDARCAQSIGLVMPRCCEFGDQTKDVIARGLAESGFPAKDLEILVQRPGADKISIINAIRKLIAFDVKALVVFGGTAAREAAREAKGFPVIVTGSYDPVGQNLIQSAERPGGNLTGVQCKTSLPFLLDSILESTAVTKLGVVHHSENLDSQTQLAELGDLAAKKRFEVVTVDMKQAPGDGLAQSLAATQFVYLAAGCYPDFIDQAHLVGLGKPVATQCQQGGGTLAVFSLAADEEETLLEAGRIAARILKGEKAGTIPFSAVKKINFVINMALAQKLGLKIPFGLLSKATKIIR